LRTNRTFFKVFGGHRGAMKKNWRNSQHGQGRP